MKKLRALGCLACCLFFAGLANAQTVMPAGYTLADQPILVFKQFPQKKECDTIVLEKLFSASGNVSLSLDADYLLRGNIISRIQQNPNVETINIGLSDFPKTVFTISRIRLENGSTRFTGHVLSQEGKDALILSIENGKYYFLKTEQRLLLTE